jgi:hypothetical protein
MMKRRRISAVGAALVASALLVPGAVASARPSDDGHGRGRTLRFDVTFSPPNYTDFAEPGSRIQT